MHIKDIIYIHAIQKCQLQLQQDPIWCGSGDERVLGDSGVDVVAEGVAEGVADGVVDGESVAVGESVLGIKF